jgi:hypothetical protein
MKQNREKERKKENHTAQNTSLFIFLNFTSPWLLPLSIVAGEPQKNSLTGSLFLESVKRLSLSRF